MLLLENEKWEMCVYIYEQQNKMATTSIRAFKSQNENNFPEGTTRTM